MLFDTHEDLEHLAMMERVLGSLPEHMIERAKLVALPSQHLFCSFLTVCFQLLSSFLFSVIGWRWFIQHAPSCFQMITFVDKLLKLTLSLFHLRENRCQEGYIKQSRLNWPEGAVSRVSIRAVRKLDNLKVPTISHFSFPSFFYSWFIMCSCACFWIRNAEISVKACRFLKINILPGGLVVWFNEVWSAWAAHSSTSSSTPLLPGPILKA